MSEPKVLLSGLGIPESPQWHEGLSTPVFAAAKEVFDKALADGWGDLDIASVHDQVAGRSALEESR